MDQFYIFRYTSKKNKKEIGLDGVNAVFTIADIFNGLMAIPNCVALLALSGVVAKETKAYFDKYPTL